MRLMVKTRGTSRSHNRLQADRRTFGQALLQSPLSKTLLQRGRCNFEVSNLFDDLLPLHDLYLAQPAKLLLIQILRGQFLAMLDLHLIQLLFQHVQLVHEGDTALKMAKLLRIAYVVHLPFFGCRWALVLVFSEILFVYQCRIWFQSRSFFLFLYRKRLRKSFVCLVPFLLNKLCCNEYLLERQSPLDTLGLDNGIMISVSNKSTTKKLRGFLVVDSRRLRVFNCFFGQGHLVNINIDEFICLSPEAFSLSDTLVLRERQWLSSSKKTLQYNQQNSLNQQIINQLFHSGTALGQPVVHHPAIVHIFRNYLKDLQSQVILH